MFTVADRLYYRLDEVASKLHLTVLDVLHLGITEQIKIGVYFMGWPVEEGFFDYPTDNPKMAYRVGEDIRILNGVEYLLPSDLIKIERTNRALVTELNIENKEIYKCINADNMPGTPFFVGERAREELLPASCKIEGLLAPAVCLTDLIVKQQDLEKYNQQKSNEQKNTQANLIKDQPKVHLNAERFAKNREEVLGAALAVLFAFPDQCKDATKMARLIDEKAKLFWPDTREPPLVQTEIARLIGKYRNIFKK